jgi:heme oxygenase
MAQEGGAVPGDIATSSGPRPARGRTPDALAELRRHTSRAHDSLDASLADDGRIADVAAYTRLLRVLADLHARAEDPLHSWLAATPWARDSLAEAPLSRRAGLFAADLSRLGAEARPVTPDPPYDDARGLAALYLLSGSTNGARVLLRRLPSDVAPRARCGLTDAASSGSAHTWRAVRAMFGEPLERAHPGRHRDLARRAAVEAGSVFARLEGLAHGAGRRAS